MDNMLRVLTILWESELCVLNLSFSDIQEMTRLEETYLDRVKSLRVTQLKICTC